MLDCRAISTPQEAEMWLEKEMARVDKMWRQLPKDEKGKALNPGFQRFCDMYDAYKSAKSYFLRRGLMCEADGRHA